MEIAKGYLRLIVALRNEKGSYNAELIQELRCFIVALRNEKGSYNMAVEVLAKA